MRPARRCCTHGGGDFGLISSTLLDTLLTPLMFWRWGEKPLERLLVLRDRKITGQF